MTPEQARAIAELARVIADAMERERKLWVRFARLVARAAEREMELRAGARPNAR